MRAAAAARRAGAARGSGTNLKPSPSRRSTARRPVAAAASRAPQPRLRPAAGHAAPAAWVAASCTGAQGAMARRASGRCCQAAEPRVQLRTRRGSAAGETGVQRVRETQPTTGESTATNWQRITAPLAAEVTPAGQGASLGTPMHKGAKPPETTHRSSSTSSHRSSSGAHLARELDLHGLLVLADAAHVGVVAGAAGVHLLGVHTVLQLDGKQGAAAGCGVRMQHQMQNARPRLTGWGATAQPACRALLPSAAGDCVHDLPPPSRDTCQQPLSGRHPHTATPAAHLLASGHRNTGSHSLARPPPPSSSRKGRTHLGVQVLHLAVGEHAVDVAVNLELGAQLGQQRQALLLARQLQQVGALRVQARRAAQAVSGMHRRLAG